MLVLLSQVTPLLICRQTMDFHWKLRDEIHFGTKMGEASYALKSNSLARQFNSQNYMKLQETNAKSLHIRSSLSLTRKKLGAVYAVPRLGATRKFVISRAREPPPLCAAGLLVLSCSVVGSPVIFYWLTWWLVTGAMESPRIFKLTHLLWLSDTLSLKTERSRVEMIKNLFFVVFFSE